MNGPSCLADTNVLLRLAKRDHTEYPVVRRAIDSLHDKGVGLVYTLQNMTEFWNVSTRSKERNGLGLNVEETEENAREIERSFFLLADTENVYLQWRRIVLQHKVRGIQVHDARLAAAMYAHGVNDILTFNISDFLRFNGLHAIHPNTVG